METKLDSSGLQSFVMQAEKQEINSLLENLTNTTSSLADRIIKDEDILNNLTDQLAEIAHALTLVIANEQNYPSCLYIKNYFDITTKM